MSNEKKNNLDIVDRLLLKKPHHDISGDDLAEAACEIRDLRETVYDLNGWCAGVEADNDTLRREIERLEKRNAALSEQIDDLHRRIGNASILLSDWDGYYNPTTKKGNAEELARLVEEGFMALQGRSWRKTEQEDTRSNDNA